MELLRVAQSPGAPGFVADPFPFYLRLLAAPGPVFWSDLGMVALARRAEIDAVLRSPDFGRADPSPPSPERGAFADFERHSMLNLDPPAHGRLRAPALRGFASSAVAALAPEIEALAHRLIDRFEGGEADLLPAFALPLPLYVTARLLGAPLSEAPRLLAWSRAVLAVFAHGAGPERREAADRALADAGRWVGARLAAAEAAPGADLFGRIAAAGAGEGRLSPEEATALVVLLLVAGHEATAHAILLAVRAVLEAGIDPAPLFADEAAARRTMEEALRFDPPLHLLVRFAQADAEAGGRPIRCGAPVALLVAAAGRDPEGLAEPDRFDPSRAAAPHLAFGAGPHHCLAAGLGWLTIRLALKALFARRPGLRLAGPVRFAPRWHFRAPAAFRVRL